MTAATVWRFRHSDRQRPRRAATAWTERPTQPLGSYVYSITFSDGHNTGSYTFEQLRALGESDYIGIGLEGGDRGAG